MIRNITLTLRLTQNCTLRRRYCYAGEKRAEAVSWETAKETMLLGLAEAFWAGNLCWSGTCFVAV